MGVYFPIQNLPNILSSKFSLVISPVMLPKWYSAWRIFTANKSPVRFVLIPSIIVLISDKLS